MYEQRELSGSLFKNDKKLTDNHPGMTGSCLINGVNYWVSSWKKEDKNGNPWLSLAFTIKDKKPVSDSSKATPEFVDSDLDALPF